MNVLFRLLVSLLFYQPVQLALPCNNGQVDCEDPDSGEEGGDAGERKKRRSTGGTSVASSTAERPRINGKFDDNDPEVLVHGGNLPEANRMEVVKTASKFVQHVVTKDTAVILRLRKAATKKVLLWALDGNSEHMNWVNGVAKRITHCQNGCSTTVASLTMKQQESDTTDLVRKMSVMPLGIAEMTALGMDHLLNFQLQKIRSDQNTTLADAQDDSTASARTQTNATIMDQWIMKREAIQDGLCLDQTLNYIIKLKLKQK